LAKVGVVSVSRDDNASAQGTDAKYGISFASRVPEEVLHQDRSDFAEATRRRLEEGVKKKEAEEREKAAQRYQRKEYRAGKISEEERQRRLAEMSAAANDHEAQRGERLKQHEEKEKAEGMTEPACTPCLALPSSPLIDATLLSAVLSVW